MKTLNLVKWLCKGAATVSMLLTLCIAANAQAAGYTVDITTAYPQLSIASTSPQVAWYGGNCFNTVATANPYNTCDDGVSPVMPIGFTFNFGGTNYSNWSMSTNGVIFFETGAVGTGSTGGTSYTPSNLPTATFPNKPALMPFWADLWKSASANGVLDANSPSQPASASFIQYQVLTQPSGAQVLVIQLKKVGYYGAAGTLVNMQVQLWSTGEIVYSYGNMQVSTNPALRIGLQYPGGGCNTLANNQSSSLSNQSYLYTWDLAAASCPAMPTVNHYEIRHDGAATLCAEPVTVLACSSATSPCPAASIISNQIINAAVRVTGTGLLGTPNISPPSFNMQPSSPLQTVNLTWSAGSSGTATLGIQAAVSASAALRCTNVAGTTAYSNCNITVANTACIAPPHHYEILGPASGTNCASHTFTIKAWADAAQTTLYTAGVATGTLTSSGNPASIPGLGAFSIPAGSSTVNITPITFPAPGTTTFSTTATPALVGATTCNFGGSTSCAFSVVSCVSDFNCVETTANAAIAADANPSTGRLYTKLAGTAFNFDVVARKSDGTVATTYASDAAKSVTVELVDGTGATACASRSALSPAASLTQNFTAGDAGRKSFSFTVANAYKDLRCRVTDNTTTPTLAKSCSLDNFAIRPSAATLVTAANAAAPSSIAAPAIKTGSGFTLQTATGAGTNYNGTLTLDNSKLSAQITTQDTTQAAGGVIGTLTPATLTANTTPTNNAGYDEVGYLYLAPGAYRDDSYTAVDSATGDCVTSTTGNAYLSTTLASGKYGCSIGNQTAVSLGRFIPDHFDVLVNNNGAMAAACPAGGFTYAGQTINYSSTNLPSLTIKPMSAASSGHVTQNYVNKFQKLTAAGISLTTPTTDATQLGKDGATKTALTATLNTGALTNSAGTMTYTLAATDQFTYTRNANALIAPYTTAIPLSVSSVSDSEITAGILPTLAPAGVSLRYGRLKMQNTYGSELLNLPIPLEAQYWNGTSYIRNQQDSCTSIAAGAIAMSNYRNNLNACETQIGYSSGAGSFTSGISNFLRLTAPGAGNNGSVDLTVNLNGASGNTCAPASGTAGNANMPWFGANPNSRATFGIYKTPVIYLRENY